VEVIGAVLLAVGPGRRESALADRRQAVVVEPEMFSRLLVVLR
jgi:hypothetical protein